MPVRDAFEDIPENIKHCVGPSQMQVRDDFEVTSENVNHCVDHSQTPVPEAFEVDGAPREVEMSNKKKIDRKNKISSRKI